MNTENSAKSSAMVQELTRPNEVDSMSQANTSSSLGGETSLILIGTLLIAFFGVQSFMKLVRSVADDANK